jgi:beta-glucosidase/6-phospho-beta-glucosidase/beta-galactosidase
MIYSFHLAYTKEFYTWQDSVVCASPTVLWGTASSSYQEGGNTNNQWYRCRAERAYSLGEEVEMPAALVERLKMILRLLNRWNNARLSLNGVVLNLPRTVDSSAIDRYRAMLKALRTRHLKPIVTLHHFTDQSGSRNVAALQMMPFSTLFVM